MAIGASVDLDRVLALADGAKLTAGAPTVNGAKVVATSQGEGRNDKVIIFKYIPKHRHHMKRGHHQSYTRLKIDRIVTPEEVKSGS